MFQSSPHPKAGRNVARCKRCRPFPVSILAPPEGRAQQINSWGLTAFLRVSILAPPEGRAQRDPLRHGMRVYIVAILAPPEGRAQPGHRPVSAACSGRFNPRPTRRHGATSRAMRGIGAPCRFQSSPHPKAGRNSMIAAWPEGSLMFQSSPHPKAGRNGVFFAVFLPSLSFVATPDDSLRHFTVCVRPYSTPFLREPPGELTPTWGSRMPFRQQLHNQRLPQIVVRLQSVDSHRPLVVRRQLIKPQPILRQYDDLQQSRFQLLVLRWCHPALEYAVLHPLAKPATRRGYLAQSSPPFLRFGRNVIRDQNVQHPLPCHGALLLSLIHISEPTRPY